MDDPFLTFHPPVPWGDLLPSGDSGLEAYLPGSPWFFEYARDALFWAFRALRAARPSQITVWMPAFHCGMEVRTAVDAGFKPRFFPLNAGLGADLEALEEGLRKDPGPVMIIHYFGFGDPEVEALRALCDRHGVALVEDASHALFSKFRGRLLGGFGSIATISPYKSLGTLDGGLLTFDRSSLETLGYGPVEDPGPRPRGIWPFAAYLEGVRRGLYGPGWLRLRRHRRYTSTKPSVFEARIERSRSRIFDSRREYGVGLSWLSERQIRGVDPERIVERRRSRWTRLDRRLREYRGYRPLYDLRASGLSEGLCPLYLPLLVKERQRIWLTLEARRIRPFVFGYFHHPALDPEAYPETRCLREDLLCLPVHHALNDAEIDHLASVVGPQLAS